MIGKIKVIKLILLLLVFLSAVYLIWRIARPIEIVDVHTTQTDDIVIRNPPLTGKQLINWWEENKNAIHKKYGIPTLDPDGTFWVTIWDVGDGYEKYDNSKGVHFFESTPDQVCFEDMNTDRNCLDKDKKLAIFSKASTGTLWYGVYGVEYYQNKAGEIVKSSSD